MVISHCRATDSIMTYRKLYKIAFTICLSFILSMTGLSLNSALAERQDKTITKGKELYASGKLKESIVVFNDYLKANPNNMIAHYYLALAFYRTKQTKLAYKHAKTVVEDQPNSAMGKYSAYLMGHMLTGRKNVSKSDGFAGLKIKKNVVSKVFRGGPAEQAGLKFGDRILKVDGLPVVGLSTRAIAKLIIGPVGSTVVLKVNRSGKTQTIRIKRGPIYGEAKRAWIK